MDQLLGSVVPFLIFIQGNWEGSWDYHTVTTDTLSPSNRCFFFISVALILVPLLFQLNTSKERVKIGGRGNRER